jgi:hypothetical protein
MVTIDELRQTLENLTGHKSPLKTKLPDKAVILLNEGAGLGLSQFNELLLIMGYDRVTSAFFQFLVDGSTKYNLNSSIRLYETLKNGVDRFRKIALLLFGNVKYAFKNLSRSSEQLEECLEILSPIDENEFQTRHDPVLPVEEILPEHTFYLGYLIEEELQRRLKDNPNDEEAKSEEALRISIIKKGQENHKAYLASDHLDVYVATSMRRRHEYIFVNRITKKIFSHNSLKTLKLRWFDPTQSYCKNRIDKGIAEALMLKRAKCTIYLAQETDTLGKDSELASTLAQGKPVIAYVPKGNREYVNELLSDLKEIHKKSNEAQIILEQLRIFDPSLGWSDPEVQHWIRDPTNVDMNKLRQKFEDVVKSHYDNRANTLSQNHPLGIQVNLSTGVANGVLVVRTISDCARLIKCIVTRKMEFDLEIYTDQGCEYLLLKEKISGSIFRVVTGDEMLTNTFWNYYLEPSE